MEKNLLIKENTARSSGIKFSFDDENGNEIARATLFILSNDLHNEPFGMIEDLFVNEAHRGQGIATNLINHIIEKAKENNCYKLIATSRYGRDGLHEMYKKFGFEDYGKEFRMNF
jgi:GNAT superfamily N-acetyltransferase